MIHYKRDVCYDLKTYRKIDPIHKINWFNVIGDIKPNSRIEIFSMSSQNRIPEITSMLNHSMIG